MSRDGYDRCPHGEYVGDPCEDCAPARRLTLVPASSITPRRVEWLWTDRIPLGEVTLTPGRAGLGKSTYHAWVIAQVTRGTLSGIHHGHPRSAIIAASEDSWARTIVPRLIAADADLDRVFRVEVVSTETDTARLSLPADCALLAELIPAHDVALVSLDPLMSVIHASIDTHRNSEVRTVMEPLSRLADATGAVFLGNAHFNKSAGTDPLALITGSAAFGEVIRAAVGFARDPEADDGSFVLSQIKNNLGRLDLPSLRYVIESTTVDTKDGPAEVGRFCLLGESERSVADILGDRADAGEPGERDQAAEWLTGYLIDKGGEAAFADLSKAARANGHAERTVRRAASRAGVQITSSGFPRRTVWSLETTVRPQSGQSGHPHETGRTGPTVAGLALDNRAGYATAGAAKPWDFEWGRP